MRSIMNDNLAYLTSRIINTLNPNTGYVDAIAANQLKSDLQALLVSLQTKPPTISAVTADFYDVLTQLQEHIRVEDTWKDFYVSSTGKTLLDVCASIGAFLQSSIQIAFRESFIQTANRSSSVYAATRMLGVKITRKTSAKVKTWLVRSIASGTTNIPAYTQFSVGGKSFFNANEIIFPNGEALIPLNVTFDDSGNVVRKDSIITQVYTGDIIFPNVGQIYYPCSGVIYSTDDTGAMIAGTINIASDSSGNTTSAFGSISFNSQLIVSTSSVFKIELTQFSGTIISGTFVPKSKSAFLRFPTTITFQIKRSGVGASIITPALGTANIPKTAIVITNESIQDVQKYATTLLDKAIVIFDNDIFLHSGRVISIEHTTVKSSVFYSIALSEPGFIINNDLIYVEVFNGTSIDVWTKADKQIWDYGPTDKVFYDSTLSNGDCVLNFGDGIHGEKIKENWIIGVRYVITDGILGNIGEVGADVSCLTYAVTGMTLTAPYGGADEKDSSYYKQIAPTLFRSKGTAVTQEDHHSILLSYPNVADVAILGQKDIAPYDIRFMNRLTVVLLPQSPNISFYPKFSQMEGKPFNPAITNAKDSYEPNLYKFSDLELTEYLNKFKAFAFSCLDLDFFKFATPRAINLKIRAFVYNQHQMELTSSKLSASLATLFIRSPGILGRSLMIADIISVCNLPEVDFVEVIQPSFDIILGSSVAERTTFVCLENSAEIIVEYTSRRNFNV